MKSKLWLVQQTKLEQFGQVYDDHEPEHILIFTTLK